MGLVLLALAAPACAQVVSFPDPNLEQAVRDRIGKPTGDILKTDLDGVTNLDASSRGIVNLTGLDQWEDLEFLNLGSNDIVDLSPLSGLVKLENLVLGTNDFSDVSPLAALVNLTRLSIDRSSVVDIGSLNALVNLRFLDITSNQVSDISVVSNYILLEEFFCGDNPINGGLDPLAGLVELFKLHAWSCGVTDISALQNLTKLDDLQLANNPPERFPGIVDLDALAGLPVIRVINLSNQWHFGEDLCALAANPGLGAGDELSLDHNVLYLAPGSPDQTCIDQITAKGVTVSVDNQRQIAELEITNNDINFDPDPPRATQPAEITATVRNLGAIAASNVVVRFFAGNPALPGAQQIGDDQTIAAIEPEEEQNAAVTWQAPHNKEIFVVVDPEDEIAEVFEDNNTASDDPNTTPKPPAPPSGGGGDLVPFANAGPDLQGCVGQPITLSGMASFDPDGAVYRTLGQTSGLSEAQQIADDEDLTFAWQFAVRYWSEGVPVLKIPEGSRTTNSLKKLPGSEALFIPDVPGEYALLLTVTDKGGNYSFDQVQVIVDDCACTITPPALPEPSGRLLVTPNPFSDAVIFTFDVVEPPDAMRLVVYSLSGRIVWRDETFADRELTWIGRDTKGNDVANGAYVFVVTIHEGGTSSVHRGTLLRFP